MALRTRLNEMLDVEHPIISAPMAFAAGGLLAATVTSAGGLGRSTIVILRISPTTRTNMPIKSPRRSEISAQGLDRF